MTGSAGGALLETLGEVVRTHDSHGVNELTVVPLLYRSMDAGASSIPFTSALGVAAASAHLLGATLLDTTAAEFDSPIETVRDPVLEGVLPATVAGRLGPATELHLDYSNGALDARLRRRGQDIQATGGEARFLAVVRALFSPELRSATFAALSYREGDLDSRFGPSCFRMICGLQDHPGLLATLRTLLVLVETPREDPEVHCPAGVGARYLIKEERALRRHPPERLRSEIGLMVQQADRPLVLFLGAGFGVSSGLPIGNGLRDEAIARMLGEPPDADIDWGRELFRRQQGLLTPSERLDIDEFAAGLTFEQVTRMEKEHAGTEVPQGLLDFETIHETAIAGPAVRQLQRMLAEPKRLIIVTVNFDELLEAGQADRLDVLIDDNAFQTFAESGLDAYLASSDPARNVPYLKLHGSIGDLSSCIASSRQTQQGLSPAKRAALDALAATGEPLRWVYVGASMRDVDLRPFFDDAVFRGAADERWVVPFPEDTIERFAVGREQLRRWETVGLRERFITETADTFITELASEWLR